MPSCLCFRNLIDDLKDFFSGDRHQAIVMRTQVNLLVAFELEAWAAGELVSNDSMPGANRRGPPQVGGAVNGNHWSSNRNRSVHKTAVIAHQQIASLD